MRAGVYVERPHGVKRMFQGLALARTLATRAPIAAGGAPDREHVSHSSTGCPPVARRTTPAGRLSVSIVRGGGVRGSVNRRGRTWRNTSASAFPHVRCATRPAPTG